MRCLIIFLLLLFIACESSSDVILTESEEITYYNIIYNGNNHTSGYVPVDSNEYESNDEINIIGNYGNLIKTGYKFSGWTYGVLNYFENNIIYISENITLYAKWVPYELQDTGPAGGYIFHDKGSYSDGWRYLESAPLETEWTSKQWGSYGYIVDNTNITIGSGQYNTNQVVDWFNENEDDTYNDVTDKTERAAYLCYSLEYNGYDDWFLPSFNELKEMYEILHSYDIGGFSDDNYWSSSEIDIGDPTIFSLILNFTNGNKVGYSKVSERRVRAIRSF